MLRLKIAGAVLLSLVAAVAVAGDYGCGSDDNGGCWHNFWTIYHRNNVWMEPFIYPDRASICNVNEMQIAKGWQAQNLLGDPHFDADSNKLSTAGMIKLRWILTQTPMQYRNVFVQRGLSEDITVRRLAAAQAAAGDIVGGPVPEVLVSNMPLNSMPADYVNGVNTWFGGYMQGIAKPQPTAFQNDSSSGSSP